MYSSTTARRMAALRSSSICRADVTDPQLTGVAFGRLTTAGNSQVTAFVGRSVVTPARYVGAGMARSDEGLLVWQIRWGPMTEVKRVREPGEGVPEARARSLLTDLVNELAVSPSGVAFIASCLDQ